MYKNKKVVVVMPAYNAEKTLRKTLEEIPFDLVDDVVLCDDYSNDNTAELAESLGIKHVIRHDINKGYGANQKSLYTYALKIKADIVIMLHPDYQYTPKLIPSMTNIIGEGLYDVVLGSRILGKGALKGGMPIYKYISNRILTLIQNVLLNSKLSEFHTGYRTFSKEVLEKINYQDYSDDFIFDNQMLSEIIYRNFEIAEITCPTKYFEEASSINFSRSVQYGVGVLKVSVMHFLARTKIYISQFYKLRIDSAGDLEH